MLVLYCSPGSLDPRIWIWHATRAPWTLRTNSARTIRYDMPPTNSAPPRESSPPLPTRTAKRHRRLARVRSTRSRRSFVACIHSRSNGSTRNRVRPEEQPQESIVREIASIEIGTGKIQNPGRRLLPRPSVSEVVSASPMHEEQKTERKQRHEKIILSDHDTPFHRHLQASTASQFGSHIDVLNRTLGGDRGHTRACKPLRRWGWFCAIGTKAAASKAGQAGPPPFYTKSARSKRKIRRLRACRWMFPRLRGRSIFACNP